jgi:hypothetical protein
MRSIEQIRELLAEVKKHDRKREVFGAETHRYRTRRARPAEIAVLEQRIGIRLPEEYRAFLQEVGYGAGPYYGLYSPGTVWQELDGLQPEPAEEEPQALPAHPFPLLVPPAPGAGSAAVRFPCDGAIFMGEQGSGTQWSLLVTAGAAAGTVWDVGHFEGPNGECFGARRPPGLLQRTPRLPPLPSPPRFLDWYAGWLEQCLSDLRTALPSQSGCLSLGRLKEGRRAPG